MDDLTDDERNVLERAQRILQAIANELSLAERAHDPYSIEQEYIDMMLAYSQRLVFFDAEEGAWSYQLPTLWEAYEIIASHTQE